MRGKLLWLAMITLMTGCMNNNNQSIEQIPTEQSDHEAAANIDTGEDIALDSETLRNTSGKVMLMSLTQAKAGNGGHATIAIVSSAGTVIMADPSAVPRRNGLIRADVITSSHGHADHHDLQYEKESVVLGTYHSNRKAETFSIKDVDVSGIAASHSAEFDPEHPSNTIYVYNVDGLRIAHMGDIGQEKLSEEQLRQIGKIDMLFLPFSDVSQFGFVPEHSIAIIEQLKPAMVSPLHYTSDAIETMIERLGIKERIETDTMLLNRESLAEYAEQGMTYVFLR
jgi:hypothetical protein